MSSHRFGQTLSLVRALQRNRDRGGRGSIARHRASVLAQRAAVLARARGAVVIAPTSRRRRTINQRTSGFVGPSGDAKYVDYANREYDLNTTGSIQHLSIVAQGSSVNKRDGRAFRVTSVQFRGQAMTGSICISTGCTAMLVWDKQPNKALAAITDILDSAHSWAMNKRENASRFVVIRRWDWVMQGKGDGTTIPGIVKNFNHYVKLPKDCVCTCTAHDDTGEIGNRITGALLFVTVGNRVAGDADATLYVTARVNFQDI